MFSIDRRAIDASFHGDRGVVREADLEAQLSRYSDLLEQQARYAKAICAWLDRCFPDLHTHPAAVAAVIRLHYRYGKGNLTASKHGVEIREAVTRWDESFAASELESKEAV